STTDEAIQKIFEPGATLPTRRLEAVKQSVEMGLHTGVSLMPLLPYISDTAEHLTEMLSIFKNLDVKYILPASLTLFGTNPTDSKPLMLSAIRKNYPELEAQYSKLYSYGFQPPKWYRDMVDKRAQACCQKFSLKNSIV
ncbi:MAG TPA: radical SAM protein, partial [Chryseolinea sp.]